MNIKQFYVAKCYKHFSPAWLEGLDDRRRAEAYLSALQGEHPDETYVLFERCAAKARSEVVDFSCVDNGE